MSEINVENNQLLLYIYALFITYMLFSVKELSKQSRLAGISRRGKEDEIPRSVIRLLVKVSFNYD